MKRIIWPLIHPFKFNSKISFKEWGWITQDKINQFCKKKVPSSDYINLNLYDYNEFNEKDFIIGSKMGYNRIYESYNDNQVDFTNYDFTVPELSMALNYFKNNDKKKINTCLKNIDAEILGIWTEFGLVKYNSNFLGLWNKNIIKQELLTGGLGPENLILWDKKPIRQKVRVKYILKDRIDVWEWQRCISLPDSNWCVSNMNQIIIL